MPTPSLPVLDPTAAAIDVGSEQLHVSVAGGPPKVFGTTTGQLRELRDWLKAQGVQSVAMEATGIYWLCPYEVLEQAGLRVVMVNGKYVKNLPGRKTDMKDCQWQATLHAHGLLQPGFVPPAHIRRLQDYLRVRADHVVLAGSHEQHMQKALDRMNLKIHDVLSDLTGKSGLQMVEAILKGERDPAALLALCDPQIQKRKASQLKAALEGNWKEEHLFALRQAHELWQCYQEKIAECDVAIEKVLQEIAGPEAPAQTVPQATTRGGGQHAADRRAACAVVSVVREQRPDDPAGGGRSCAAAIAWGSGHGPGQKLAERKALHGVAGPGAGQPAEWEAARQSEARAQSGGPAVLCDRAECGAQRGQSPGRVLPAAQRAARGLGGESGAGAQAGGTVLAADGPRQSVRRTRSQKV